MLAVLALVQLFGCVHLRSTGTHASLAAVFVLTTLLVGAMIGLSPALLAKESPRPSDRVQRQIDQHLGAAEASSLRFD